jgi:hypothetical protein
MKVRELIEQLMELNPDLEVYAFNDSELNEITFAEEVGDRVDINLGKSL